MSAQGSREVSTRRVPVRHVRPARPVRGMIAGMGRQRVRVACACAVVAVATAACGTSPPESSAPQASARDASPIPSPASDPAGPSKDAATESAAQAQAQAPAGARALSGLDAEAPAWVVGASPLPTNPDGSVPPQRTPEVLRSRSLQSQGRLPPPTEGTFAASVGPVTDEVRRIMGISWKPGCPVALNDLRHLTVSIWGFDDQPHTGELVVNASVAEDLVAVFRTLFEARFPIEDMRLPTTEDIEAPPYGDGNITASTVCRPVKGTSTWSQHSYGLAIDVNPFQNPYVRGATVVPELAEAYTDRSWLRPGMITDGDVVVRAFASIGWEWGGHWRGYQDYMHFSRNGH